MGLAEQSSRLKQIDLELSDAQVTRFKLDEYPRADRLELISKRRNHSRLGKFERWPNDKIDNELFLTEAEGNLIDFLFRLESGVGYLTRVKNAVADVHHNQEWMRALRVIAAYHLHGYAAHARVVSDCSSIRLGDLLGSYKKVLSGVVQLDYMGFKTPNKLFSREIWAQTPKPEKLAVLISILKALAPQINIQAIKRKTRETLVARSIMKHKFVEESLGAEAALEFFDALESQFSWHSRYWEQRALLLSKFQQHEKAYSYAQKAVSLEYHPFPLNTLGTVCLKNSLYLFSFDEETAEKMYSEGVNSLERSKAAANDRDTVWEHPYRTFFSSVLFLLRSRPSFAQTFTRKLQEDWKGWLDSAKNDAGAYFSDIELGKLQRNFENALAKLENGSRVSEK